MKLLLITGICLATFSCNKDFLEASPSSNLITPTTIQQLTGILSNYALMQETPVLGEQSADDYYIQSKYFDSISPIEQNVYTWKADLFEGAENIPDYNLPYSKINSCNIVLETLANIEKGAHNQYEWNKTKGWALFIRSYAFFNVAQLFSKVYDKEKAADELGIVLPFTSDLDSKYSRASMKQTFDQILRDLKTAAILLPAYLENNNKYIPSKIACHALLARVYLYMSDFENGRLYADSCLSYHNMLMDFNDLDLSQKFPIPENNSEVIYQSWLNSNNNVILGWIFTNCNIDSALYNSYHANDLRKNTFFLVNKFGKPYFRCNYTGKIFAFSGLASDEMYLIRAECNARMGNIPAAMEDINHLLNKRYAKGTFEPCQAGTIQEALSIVLKERRKELVFRGLRWPDLKRMNSNNANINLNRVMDNIAYHLPANSNRFVLPIPNDAIKGSDVVQNIRD